MLLSWEARKARVAVVGEGAPTWRRRGRGPVGFPVNFGPADRQERGSGCFIPALGSCFGSSGHVSLPWHLGDRQEAVPSAGPTAGGLEGLGDPWWHRSPAKEKRRGPSLVTGRPCVGLSVVGVSPNPRVRGSWAVAPPMVWVDQVPCLRGCEQHPTPLPAGSRLPTPDATRQPRTCADVTGCPSMGEITPTVERGERRPKRDRRPPQGFPSGPRGASNPHPECEGRPLGKGQEGELDPGLQGREGPRRTRGVVRCLSLHHKFPEESRAYSSSQHWQCVWTRNRERLSWWPGVSPEAAAGGRPEAVLPSSSLHLGGWRWEELSSPPHRPLPGAMGGRPPLGEPPQLGNPTPEFPQSPGSSQGGPV